MHKSLDTFTHFLFDNLKDGAGVVIPVHQMRQDALKPALSAMQMNAVNIQIGSPDFNVAESSIDVSLHVCNDNELIAIDWAEQLVRLLDLAAYVPKMDYSNPATPVATGGWIFWDTHIRFRPITKNGYAHFYAPVTLHHHFS